MKKTILSFLMLLSAIVFSQEQNRLDENGKRQGLWVEESSNDNSMTIKSYYQDGIRNGIYQTYRDDKLIGDGFMKDGELHGEFIGYDENGNKTSILKWDMGKLIGQELLNPNAKETGTIEEINGKKYVWLFGKLEETEEIIEN